MTHAARQVALAFGLFASVASVAACEVGESSNDSTAGSSLSDSDKDGGHQGIGSFSARVCADGAVTKGVDVSYYESTINWPKAQAAGIGFAFIRVSDGTTYKDPKFASNWAGSKSAGVIRGAYQFFRPAESITQQANIMISAIGTYEAGDLPPVLDVEQTGGKSPSTIASEITQWTGLVQAALGVTPIIYTGKYFWRDQVGGSTKQEQNPLWVAQYTNQCPDLPAPWTRWTFWQNSESGTVPGIPGHVDLDQFNGSLDDLRAFAQGGGTVTPTVALPFNWTVNSDGSYTFAASPGDDVASVEFRVDDYLIGTADNSGGDAEATYTFDTQATGRAIEVRGIASSGAVVSVGNGLIDSTATPQVFVRQTGDSEYEIGLPARGKNMDWIDVTVDGIQLTDSVSGQNESKRLAIDYAFSQTGDRALVITARNAKNQAVATYSRTLNVR